MGFKERRQQHKEEFREEILSAAQEIFSKEGYAHFSMRKLATRIDHSPTTIYRYFRDKAELLFHICEDVFLSLRNRIEEILSKEHDPFEALRLSLLGYMTFGFSNPEQYKVAYFSNPELYGSPDEFMARDTMGLRFYRTFRKLVEKSIRCGSLRDADVDLVSQTLLAATHGLVTNVIFIKDFPMQKPELMMETLVDALMRGFAV